MVKRILIVEDDAGLTTGLRDRLQAEGYSVEIAADGQLGFEMAAAGGFDLVILDIMLPNKSGLDVCRDLRRMNVEVPILFLTARGETYEKVLGLKLGGDDYLAKPFEAIELLARIESLLRRRVPSSVGAPPQVRFGDILVDLRRMEVTKGGQPVSLTAKEFQLLRYLLDHRGATVSRNELLKDVWGLNFTDSTRTVDVHIAELRKKLENNPKHPEWILTIHKLGYKFAG